jgi:hypothetical protein
MRRAYYRKKLGVAEFWIQTNSYPNPDGPAPISLFKMDSCEKRSETEKLQETSMDPWSMFLYAMKAPMTRKKYRGRLVKFFDFIELQGLIEERLRVFAERAKKDLDWVFVNILRFAQVQKERVEKGEISPATFRNYIKAVKLFCEMNDVTITWKKITRGLPKARRFADGRAPTLDEISKITEYPDRRIKPVVYDHVQTCLKQRLLTMISSDRPNNLIFDNQAD